MGDTLVVSLRRNDVTATFERSMYEMALSDRGEYIAETVRLRTSMNDLPVARNAGMERLIESSYEWLLFVDSDMGFQQSALAVLRQAADPVDRPVVGGLCFAQRDMSPDGRNGFRWEPRATIMDWLDDYPDGRHRFSFRHFYPVNMLVQCDATGAAFLLIHRSVAMRMLNRFGKNWFTRLEDPDGLMSEDISFFKRLIDLDGPGRCYIHTGVRISHQKDTWLTEADFWEKFDPPPASDRVDVIVPVLHRPQNVGRFMESLIASTGLATAWFVCDPGDDEEVAEVLKHGGRVIEHPGSFAKKVNHAYKTIQSDAPWVFLVGDDVGFRPGWLDHAQFVGKAFEGDVVGTNDLGNPRVTRGDHATHLLINRRYIDTHGASWDGGPGTVCHEGYGHWYVDDEIVHAARQRGEFQMALGSYVEHLHPLFQKGVDDAVYAKGLESAERDKAVFEARASKYLKVAA
jgi:glycosyltransferase involved in cell wall biosynthesis